MKVVSASEMSRIEKLSFERGSIDEEFMETVGKKIAYMLPQFYDRSHPIILLCGKGNNAGDAYVTGCYLIEKGYKVKAWQFFNLDDASPLCKKNAHRFQLLEGIIEECPLKMNVDPKAIFLDGIFGTGFQGDLDENLKQKIDSINDLHRPIFALDIPSAINGNTGLKSQTAINADYTFFLELPKRGFFINDGPKHTGRLIRISFGLPSFCIEEAKSVFELIDEEKAISLLPQVERIRHKYQRGYVVGLSGSKNMPGAAFLSSDSALRGGAGIVRLLLPKDAENQLSFISPEVIRYYYDFESVESIKQMLKEAGAIYIGPGIGVTLETKKLLKELLKSIDRPLVLDADALTILSEEECIIPKKSLLTPHLAEMCRLLKVEKPALIDDVFLKKCQSYADEHDVILLLKGVPTFIFSLGNTSIVSERGDPGMATAGSGDVLTGLIASLLSQNLNPLDAATLGVFIHSLAGEISASEKTSYSLVASDIIEAIAKAYKTLESIKNY